MLYISTKSRQCSYKGCHKIFSYNNLKITLRPMVRYCYKHQKYDIYSQIDILESKLFKNNYIEDYNLTLDIKLKIFSIFKFQQIINDIKKLIKLYKNILNITSHDIYIKKYILYKEYLNYLRNIDLNKEKILCYGIILDKYSFTENIKFLYNRNNFNTYNKFFFINSNQSKDLVILRKNLEKDDFFSYSIKNNFHKIFSEDIENLIYEYYESIDYNDDFEDNYFLKLKLNLEMRNKIIFYQNIKSEKYKFLKI